MLGLEEEVGRGGGLRTGYSLARFGVEMVRKGFQMFRWRQNTVGLGNGKKS